MKKFPIYIYIEAQNCIFIGPCEITPKCMAKCVKEQISNKGFCVPDSVHAGMHCCCQVP